jgi:hypothetical protein
VQGVEGAARAVETYRRASAAQRRVSSSLYFVAALLVYFALWSLLASAAEPPWDWKYFVALSLPPTFITRSWSHCQMSRLVERTNEMWTPMLRWLDEQSRQR